MSALHPTSRHFHLEPLTDGVYAAIAKSDGAAMSNAGIVDLGDGCLIFDTLMSMSAARNLVATAEQVTGQPTRVAVNSHWHPDHVLGNAALPSDCTLISTQITRDLLAERLPERLALGREAIPRELQALEAKFETETDLSLREELGRQIDHYRLLLSDVPLLEMRLPDITFERRLVLHSPARRVELITFGAGHTASDAILMLPDDGIAFVADLLFYEIHPWVGDGDLDAWLHSLDAIDALDPPVEVVVPGHGAVCTPEGFAGLRRYFPALRRLVDGALERGASLDSLTSQPVPAAFSAWEGGSRFAANLTALYQNAAASKA